MTTVEIQQLTEFLETMRHLRSKQGCAWDRKQTPESLRPYILEEAYEVIDAIENGETSEILAELGDLLLQIVFLAQIFSEREIFGIGDIAEGINNKLRRRHPHIYPDNNNQNQHLDWEQIKQQELQEKGKSTDITERLPANLPALKLADKICRYLQESGQAYQTEDKETQTDAPRDEHHLGQAIFSLVCQGQKHGLDADLALRDFLKTHILKQQKP